MPDFGTGTNSVAVAGGQTKTATVPLTITAGSFTNFNRKVAQRCTMTFTATALVSENTDPTVSNNATTVELNVIDKNRAENTVAVPPHEAFIKSVAPVSLSVAGGTPVVKRLRVSVGNGDYLPPADRDAMRITCSDGTCPARTATTGALDADPQTAGDQDTGLVDGGRTRTGSVQLTIDPTRCADTPNAKAPVRCTAVLSAVGPTDPDPTNNSTHLVIDAVDRSDPP